MELHSISYYMHDLQLLTLIFTYAVQMVLPVTLTAFIVSACFKEYKTKDLFKSLLSLFFCILIPYGIGIALIVVFAKSLTPISILASIIMIVGPFFLYGFTYKASGFKYTIKRSFLAMGLSFLFMILSGVLLTFIETNIGIKLIWVHMDSPLNWAIILTVTIIALYPAALMFLVLNKLSGSNEYNNNMTGLQSTQLSQYR